MSRKMGLWEAVSIAVGTMIGASIFSIFGLGATIAGHDLPLVFLCSGVAALFVGYSYARLGSAIVSNAGPMEYVLRAFGDGVLAGTLSVLSWLTYVVSVALFAKGFAGYFLPLIGLASTPLSTGLAEVLVIAAFTSVNFLGAETVGRTELIIVAVKVSVLAVFIVIGIWTIRPAWIAPAFGGDHTRRVLDAAAVFFLSYMGFGLITNASEDMANPSRDVPRAIYLSIGIVTFIYVAVAAVAVGNLPLDAIVKAKDYALAEAARPVLGSAGYLLISLGAIFSISSALNATLYGGANIAYALAKDGELPEVFERKTWFHAPEGLYATAILGSIFALVFNLNGIASITSAVFMVIYIFVLLAHLRLVETVGGRRGMIVTGIGIVIVMFAVLMLYQWNTDRRALIATAVVLAAAAGLEIVYRVVTGRRLVTRTPMRAR